MTDKKLRKAIRFVEFLLGDINWPRDAHLRSKQKNKHVPLDVILSFDRMKGIGVDIPTLADALQDSPIVYLNEERTGVRRTHKAPKQSRVDITATLRVTGFPDQPYKNLDAIEAFLDSYGRVLLHTRPGFQSWRKSNKHNNNDNPVVVQYDSHDEAMGIFNGGMSWEGQSLTIEWKKDYDERIREAFEKKEDARDPEDIVGEYRASHMAQMTDRTKAQRLGQRAERQKAEAETEVSSLGQAMTRRLKRAKNFSERQLERTRMKAGLPIFGVADTIVDAVTQHRVTVIKSETGSGKTTQIPQYLHQAGFERIMVTQPRQLAAIELSQRVSEETRTLKTCSVKYAGLAASKVSNANILFGTDAYLLSKLKNDAACEKFDVVIVDEVHERTARTDILLGAIKGALKTNSALRVVLMSATIDTEMFNAFFKGFSCVTVEAKGKLFPIDMTYMPGTEPPATDDACCERVVESLEKLEESDPDCLRTDVLVFMPSALSIDKTYKRIKGMGWNVYRLHGKADPDERAAALKTSGSNSARKIVLCTNIAESSITIPGVDTVIDTGCEKRLSRDPRSGLVSLEMHPVSQSSADQRKGRAGRTCDGVCIRLYSQDYFSRMERARQPEVTIIPLETVCLTLMSLSYAPQTFGWLTSPGAAGINTAAEILYLLGLSDEANRLTDRGVDIFEMMQSSPSLMGDLRPLLAQLYLLENGVSVGIASAFAATLASTTGPPLFKQFAGMSAEMKKEVEANKVSLSDPTWREGGDVLSVFPIVLAILRGDYPVRELISKYHLSCKAINAIKTSVKDFARCAFNDNDDSLNYDLPESTEPFVDALIAAGGDQFAIMSHRDKSHLVYNMPIIKQTAILHNRSVTVKISPKCMLYLMYQEIGRFPVLQHTTPVSVQQITRVIPMRRFEHCGHGRDSFTGQCQTVSLPITSDIECELWRHGGARAKALGAKYNAGFKCVKKLVGPDALILEAFVNKRGKDVCDALKEEVLSLGTVARRTLTVTMVNGVALILDGDGNCYGKYIPGSETCQVMVSGIDGTDASVSEQIQHAFTPPASLGWLGSVRPMPVHQTCLVLVFSTPAAADWAVRERQNTIVTGSVVTVSHQPMFPGDAVPPAITCVDVMLTWENRMTNKRGDFFGTIQCGKMTQDEWDQSLGKVGRYALPTGGNMMVFKGKFDKTLSFACPPDSNTTDAMVLDAISLPGRPWCTFSRQRDEIAEASAESLEQLRWQHFNGVELTVFPVDPRKGLQKLTTEFASEVDATQFVTRVNQQGLQQGKLVKVAASVKTSRQFKLYSEIWEAPESQKHLAATFDSMDSLYPTLSIFRPRNTKHDGKHPYRFMTITSIENNVGSEYASACRQLDAVLRGVDLELTSDEMQRIVGTKSAKKTLARLMKVTGYGFMWSVDPVYVRAIAPLSMAGTIRDNVRETLAALTVTEDSGLDDAKVEVLLKGKTMAECSQFIIQNAPGCVLELKYGRLHLQGTLEAVARGREALDSLADEVELVDFRFDGTGDCTCLASCSMSINGKQLFIQDSMPLHVKCLEMMITNNTQLRLPLHFTSNNDGTSQIIPITTQSALSVATRNILLARTLEYALVSDQRDIPGRDIVRVVQPGDVAAGKRNVFGCEKCNVLLEVKGSGNITNCSCGAPICTSCFKEAAPGHLCGSMGDYLQGLNPDVVTRCPRCRILTERIDGCAAMKCACGAAFCFVCGADCGSDAHPHCHEAHGGYFVPRPKMNMDQLKVFLGFN